MFGTVNGEQLVRGQRHELVTEDGVRFSAVSIGVSVSKGTPLAAFEGVEGLPAGATHVMGCPVTGKRRFLSVPLSYLSTPRPRMFFDA